ncbi:MAG TPA: 50S ribosomal protein L28 [Clostridiales bacterium]|jgi:large subunit ribosomal protein L28|nr:50S ribosomal protein L28 [Clostridiales bacterium]
MARVCDICKKGVLHGFKVSHSNRKFKRTWAPNIKRVRAIVNGTKKRLNVCTGCLRSGKVQRSV